MKRATRILIVSLLAFSAFTLIACKDSNGGKGCKDKEAAVGNEYGEIIDEGGREAEIVLAYAQSSLSMIVGDETTPILNYTAREGESVSFTSSNASVISVSPSGRIKALGSGDATVTASYMGKTAELNVTVGFGSFVPTLVYDNYYSSSELSINKQDTLSFQGAVSFNQKLFDDVTITYTCSAGGRVEDGIYTPAGLGTETITVEATWRGKEVYVANNRFTVHTVPVVEIYANDNSADEFTLYARDTVTTSVGTFTFERTTDFVLHAYKDGEEVEVNGEFINGNDVVELQGDTVTAKKLGTAEYRASYTDGGVEYSKTFKFIVDVPVCQYNAADAPIRFTAVDGALENISYADMFGASVLQSATMGGQTLAVETGAPLGFKVNGKETPKTQVLTIVSDTVGYEINVIPYTQIIKSTEDFKIFTLESATTVFDGYYLLDDNIIWDSAYWHNADPNKTLDSLKINSVATNVGGLTGTFDGNGYAVMGMQIENGGLFGLVYGGTVKNVAFKNITMKRATSATVIGTYGASTGGLAYQLNGASLKNIYMQSDKIAKMDKNKGFVAVTIANNTKMDSCIFELPEMGIGTGESYNASYGSLCGIELQTAQPYSDTGSGAYKKEWTNVYVISPVELAVRSANGKNVYSVVDAFNQVPATVVAADYLAQMYGYSAEAPATPHATDPFKVYPVYSKEDGNVCEGIRRYDTLEEMLEANRDYSYFDESFWTVEEGGIPVFNALKGEDTSADIEISTPLSYEQATGDIDLSALFLEQGETVERIVFVDTLCETSYEDGKLTVTGFKADGQLHKIRIVTTQKAYVANVKAVTKILKTTDDFKIFTLESATTVFDGYYLLGNNITWDSAYWHNADPNKTLDSLKINSLVTAAGGLTGTFDGNGYAVTGMQIENGGLFGLVYGGTVKNVAFKNITMKRATSATVIGTYGASTGGLAYQLNGASLKNIYMQSDKIAKMDKNKGFVAVTIANNTKMDSCIFELPEMGIGTGGYYNASYGSLCGIELQTAQPYSDTGSGAYKKEWTNVYVISPVELAVRSANGKNAYSVVDAFNQVPATVVAADYLAQMYGYSAEAPATPHATDPFKVYPVYSKEDGNVCRGIKRYDDLDEMIADSNSYGEFDTELWDTSGATPVFKAKANA